MERRRAFRRRVSTSCWVSSAVGSAVGVEEDTGALVEMEVDARVAERSSSAAEGDFVGLEEGSASGDEASTPDPAAQR